MNIDKKTSVNYSDSFNSSAIDLVYTISSNTPQEVAVSINNDEYTMSTEEFIRFCKVMTYAGKVCQTLLDGKVPRIPKQPMVTSDTSLTIN